MRYEKGNFITVPNKSVLKGLDAQTQVLFMWLCSFANEQGQCFPSVKRLAECCGLSKKTIIDRVKKLIELRFLTKTERFADNSQKSNLYQIHLLPSVRNSPTGEVKGKRVGTNMHPPTAPVTDITKSNELKLQELKRKKETFNKFKASLN